MQELTPRFSVEEECKARFLGAEIHETQKVYSCSGRQAQVVG